MQAPLSRPCAASTQHCAASLLTTGVSAECDGVPAGSAAPFALLRSLYPCVITTAHCSQASHAGCKRSNLQSCNTVTIRLNSRVSGYHIQWLVYSEDIVFSIFPAEAALRPVFNELCFNLESFNPAFAACLLQVRVAGQGRAGGKAGLDAAASTTHNGFVSAQQLAEQAGRQGWRAWTNVAASTLHYTDDSFTAAAAAAAAECVSHGCHDSSLSHVECTTAGPAHHWCE